MGNCDCGTTYDENGVCKLLIAEQVEVQGKDLKTWATSEPHRLEAMFECEFNPILRDQMLLVYKYYVIEGNR